MNISKFAKKYLIFAGLVLAFFVLAVLLLRSAGTFLVNSDVPQKPTPTIILMGSIADRVLQTADIYKQGLSNQILIVNNIQNGSKYLAQYNVSIPNGAQISKQALLQLNIPNNLITIIPGEAASTRDEADTLIAWIKNTQIDLQAITIVSSSAHMRRANMIFKDAFNDNNLNIKIYTIPSKYSDFNAKHWYTDRESAKQVFLEYVKISSFLLVEQWK